MLYHVNKLKNKKNPIISIDVEKVFDKIQHPFIIKNLQKGDTKGTYINTIKATYNKTIGEGDGTPLQYSCLENPMDRGA